MHANEYKIINESVTGKCIMLSITNSIYYNMAQFQNIVEKIITIKNKFCMVALNV